MEQQDLERVLRTILAELRPYASDLVLIGGWVPYLYRHYGGFTAWSGADTLTFELDLLVPQPLPVEGRTSIALLLGDAGFRPASDASAAAVWVRDVARGEKIEFIVSHQGTARNQGRFVALREQPGVAAIPLVDLDVLADHTQTLTLPPAAGLPAVEVRVPTLGAYALNKALTFIRRGDRAETGSPKMAKDLLYLGDLLAPGGEVVSRIERDLGAIAQTSSRNAERVYSAATNVGWVINGHLREKLSPAARMMMERVSAISQAAAEARLEGFLRDFHEILMECANRYAPSEIGRSDDWDEM
ncbi:GSU2403 family nucleotidyltransferase fold protein [Longimicrobium terrae]|uniref:Nucleotidyltransferase-like domain-containing protein n=1 Tax=Longimicrobium terrae TaxID=1639882 RepID=A0A841GYA8_9BACT|nr:GSU2403 family nucleotidyltransferase fold protein [Longimicrobium terrae]MBB4636359.1 hypothetical protein [Longimicrobium terrae]MBB6070755.1 hypothetical protein [Longimicrobium terrae]NNC29734.1 hypothetical protein [Longimicrobium terrae]